ncbi:uncharacterized protein [Mytilus edulis]|uniref:uncharacterized protein n=1 Tax=Mytilus edulis TaxID=6550 RepID=UPI0039EEA171
MTDIETDKDMTDSGRFDTYNQKVVRYAQDMVFLNKKKEKDFLFTCCEGISISLHSLYSIRDKLEDEIIDSYMLTLLRKNASKIEYLNCALLSMILSKRHQHVVSDCDIASDERIGVYNVGRRH